MADNSKIYTEILLDLIKQSIELAYRMCENEPKRYAYQAGVYESTLQQIEKRIGWYEEKMKGEDENGNTMGD